MVFYNFNYCPRRNQHLIRYNFNERCPDCGYGAETVLIDDNVNLNVPAYGSLPSDFTPEQIIHQAVLSMDSDIQKWGKFSAE